MNLYRLNKALHRDLGYFFIGMTIIYAISGIAVNHIRDWNPNYIIRNENFTYTGDLRRDKINKEIIDKILAMADEENNYKNHYFPDADRLKIFITGGNITVDLKSGRCILETNRRRPVIYELNFLHYNPGELWTWFSDIFCIALAFLAISGLFVIKGKNGLKWRGTLLAIAGIIIPLALLIMYL